MDALGLGPAPTAAQLRQVPPEKLLAAADQTGDAFGPVTGSALLPTDPARVITTGKIHRVPVLHGINRDEQRLQVWGYETGKYQGPIPAAQYPAEFRQAFGTAAARVLRQYPLDRYASASHALAAALTDAEHAASLLDTARALDRRTPTFTYAFADDAAPWFRDFPQPYPMGAYHAAELPYLFEVGHTQPLSATQQRLADRMIGHWAAFARTGDPGGWRKGTVHTLSPTDGTAQPTDFAERHHYAFWSTVRR